MIVWQNVIDKIFWRMVMGLVIVCCLVGLVCLIFKNVIINKSKAGYESVKSLYNESIDKVKSWWHNS